MPSVSRNEPLIGSLLDRRYAITRRIARGGMATVYLATDQRLDREVAVKVMHPHMVDDEQFVARFIREAKSAARISHPNVVNVFDQGREGDVLYLVMEYVPGMTLRDVLNRQGALTPGQALDILIPMLDALAAAYRAGIVHRDVKPENVLLTDTGHGPAGGVKVADFGLARAVATSTRTASSTGTVIGTPAYLSPELISRGIADARSDVYSAGVMLYEMLTGHPPYEGEVPVQVAFRHVNEDVPPPSEEDPGLPESLDRLVLLATSRDADNRPRDAAEYAAQARATQRGLTEAELDREPAGYEAQEQAPRQDPGATQVVDVRGVGAEVRGMAGAREARRFPTVGGIASTPGGGAHVPPAHATQRLSPGPQFSEPGTRELPQVERQRRSRTPLVVTLLLLLAAVVGGGAYYLLVGPGAYTTMPVVNGTQSQAGQALTTAGFKPSFTSAYSESVKTGNVVSTDPGAGQKVRKHANVTVVISKGTAWTTMPSVVGAPLAKATSTLKAQDITINPNPAQVYHDTIASGSVVTTDPQPKAKVQRGSKVTVTVSKGPAPVSIPDVSNQNKDQATQTLKAAGLQVKSTGKYDETVPKDNVISQSPAGGQQGHRGDTVTLTVSLGPPLVEVPSVVGKQVGEAKSILEAAGFQVNVNNFMGGYFGTVRSQDPSGGNKAPKGATITLTVV